MDHPAQNWMRHGRTFILVSVRHHKAHGFEGHQTDCNIVGSMPISRADMLRIEKLVPSSVELPEEEEESYQAGLEVFHQIHCLVRTIAIRYSMSINDWPGHDPEIHISRILFYRDTGVCSSNDANTYGFVNSSVMCVQRLTNSPYCRSLH